MHTHKPKGDHERGGVGVGLTASLCAANDFNTMEKINKSDK
jgi:hypothetical protein